MIPNGARNRMVMSIIKKIYISRSEISRFQNKKNNEIISRILIGMFLCNFTTSTDNTSDISPYVEKFITDTLYYKNDDIFANSQLGTDPIFLFLLKTEYDDIPTSMEIYNANVDKMFSILPLCQQKLSMYLKEPMSIKLKEMRKLFSNVRNSILVKINTIAGSSLCFDPFHKQEFYSQIITLYEMHGIYLSFNYMKSNIIVCEKSFDFDKSVFKSNLDPGSIRSRFCKSMIYNKSFHFGILCLYLSRKSTVKFGNSLMKRQLLDDIYNIWLWELWWTCVCVKSSKDDLDLLFMSIGGVSIPVYPYELE